MFQIRLVFLLHLQKYKLIYFFNFPSINILTLKIAIIIAIIIAIFTVTMVVFPASITLPSPSHGTLL